MTYQINQIFENEYPPEAAIWCNEQGNCYIEEIEKLNKVRRFQIKEIPAISLKDLKSTKLKEVENKYLEWRENKAVVISSLGFTADSDERANTDVIGLITTFGDNESVMFRDADNQYHQLTLEQLKTLQKEIIQNGQYSYQQKWGFESQINSAESEEDLNAISIKYLPKNFTVETSTLASVGI